MLAPRQAPASGGSRAPKKMNWRKAPGLSFIRSAAPLTLSREAARMISSRLGGMKPAASARLSPRVRLARRSASIAATSKGAQRRSGWSQSKATVKALAYQRVAMLPGWRDSQTAPRANSR
ncbi:hypothetical protein FQZ97_792350 [compost metagenome]